ncbi:MAG: hypoxanthine phosphoribosyltransferase [SAR202 cluster bacterium]|nr:hypoxanthine phosphoribosyltransferase [SAR202 cluster bacterium]MDP6716293.1 hypoxanthine phosphoribosyltransferase [SAR202 cluster bacterium]
MQIGKTLISERRIRRRVRELGAQITSDYQNRDTVLMGVLNGSVCFMADLMREISLPVEVIFIRLSSYQGTQPGEIKVGSDFGIDLSGKHVLIVEDIVDTGSTMKFIIERVTDLGASTVEICSLLDKPSRRIHPTEIRYAGFQIPDEFVVGYGLDYDGLHRNLRHVAVLEE